MGTSDLSLKTNQKFGGGGGPCDGVASHTGGKGASSSVCILFLLEKLGYLQTYKYLRTYLLLSHLPGIIASLLPPLLTEETFQRNCFSGIVLGHLGFESPLS